VNAGYTQSELDDIQAKWKLRFPPDLIAILLERRRVIDLGERFQSFDWLEAADSVITDALNWPFEGFLFDVWNGSWWPEWGEMPSSPELQKERLKEIFARAPKLIPVYGHRYIPEEPKEAGNPIFSVWQMDVICYGADLSDYIALETRAPTVPSGETKPLKCIDFWSRAVEFNNERFASNDSSTFYNRNKVLPE
jgi:hypothetical protein